MNRLLIIFIVFISQLSFAQVSTTKIAAGSAGGPGNGVVYALPEVKFRVDVWVKKVDHIKGPYANYANKLLGLNNYTEYNYSDYQIKNIQISPEYVADPTQLYFLQLGELSDKSDQNKFLQINKNGLFGGISSQESNSEELAEGKVFEKLVMGHPEFRYFADANLVERVDTIIRRVDIDTATIEKAILKRYSVEKDIATRAQDAASYLMEIRKNRFELISGYNEVAYSAGALDLMNQELKQMEDDYLALFAGKSVVSDQHYVFYYTPDGSQANIIAPVFKFSEESGVSFLTSSGGEKVSVAIKSNGLSEHLKDISTNGNINGIVYRFPETAEIWIKYGSKEFDKQLIEIPQLGKLQNMQYKQNTFELHPQSGGIKLLEIRK